MHLITPTLIFLKKKKKKASYFGCKIIYKSIVSCVNEVKIRISLYVLIFCILFYLWMFKHKIIISKVLILSTKHYFIKILSFLIYKLKLLKEVFYQVNKNGYTKDLTFFIQCSALKRNKVYLSGR